MCRPLGGFKCLITSSWDVDTSSGTKQDNGGDDVLRQGMIRQIETEMLRQIQQVLYQVDI